MKLTFQPDAVEEIARFAAVVNERRKTSARGGCTRFMEKLLDEISFEGSGPEEENHPHRCGVRSEDAGRNREGSGSQPLYPVKRAAAAALLVLIVASACGKVGPPQAPIKRTPQAINDLRVSQSGHNVTLSWTNPALYIDNNGVTDLAAVLILRNGMQISRETATAAGKPQSFTVDVTNSLGTDLSFAVQVETQRGRVSDLVEFGADSTG